MSFLGRLNHRSAFRIAASTAVSRTLMALAAGALALFVLHSTHAIGVIEDAMGAMGFDPDRAALIAGFVVEVVVVALATLPRGRSRGAVIAGGLAFGFVFRRTFLHETETARSALGAMGQFDPAGWTITLGVLVIAVIVIALGIGLLVDAARRTLIDAIAEVWAVARSRRRLRSGAGPLATLLAATLVALAAPVFSDMVNYDPDVRMIGGGGGAPPSAFNNPATAAPSASAGEPLITTPPTIGDRPWLAWLPTGRGAMSTVSLPAPWTGGSATATLSVYTPPGYGRGDRRYPVIYEVPWGIGGWKADAHIARQLDMLITTGAIPPEIVVFVSEAGGPYPDSECIDSADGREWFERFVTRTVVPYVDGHERTIPTATARTLMGFSQGATAQRCSSCVTRTCSRRPSPGAATSRPPSGTARRPTPGVRSGAVRR